MNKETISDGWQGFRDEVLKKGWPDDPVLETLVEVAFFGGAGWAMELTHDDPGARCRILAEIAYHHTSVRKRAKQGRQ
jgi:hypothetical protein